MRRRELLILAGVSLITAETIKRSTAQAQGENVKQLATTSFQPLYRIRIHAIITGVAKFEPKDLEPILAEVNKLYQKVGIQFDYSPVKDADVERGSELSDDNRGQERTNRALSYRGKLVIFFRDQSGGFSGPGEYVAMPQGVEGGLAPGWLAHELGHYFNLHHTFVENLRLEDVAKQIRIEVEQHPLAQQALISSAPIPINLMQSVGNAVIANAFDGDSRNKGVEFPVEDTSGAIHELPSGFSNACQPNLKFPISVTFINGQSYQYTFAPDQANIMGYANGCSNLPRYFSNGQIKIMRTSLERGRRNHLLVPALRWGGWFEVQGDGRTDAAPAAASLGNRIYVFVKGPTGLIFRNSARDGQAFEGWAEVQGDGRTDAAPAAASLGNRIYVFVKGPTGLIFRNSARDGQAFEGWAEAQGNGQTNTSVAAVTFSNWLYLFSKGNDNRIYYNAARGSEPFRGWNEVPGNGITDASPSVAVLNNRLYLFVKGLTGSVFCNSAGLF